MKAICYIGARAPSRLKTLTILVGVLSYTQGLAQVPEGSLGSDTVIVGRTTLTSNPLGTPLKPNDILVTQETLKTASSTLGNALAGQIGVHSSPFGGGASAPVIRGQEGVRLKVVQNGTDVVDMSHLSPDHAIGVDTLLAKQVEIVRGAPTLLYANASPAGVINVVDERIPHQKAEGTHLEVATRYNANNNENATQAQITGAWGEKAAWSASGLVRTSDDYKVPRFQLDETLNYVPDTQTKTKSGTLGATYFGDKVQFGAAVNQRNEVYGIPGHNHKLDGCVSHITTDHPKRRLYLGRYPHLMDDRDLTAQPHVHCTHDHDHDPEHSHNHPYGHNHDHSISGPKVNSNARRYDAHASIAKPLPALDKVRLDYSITHYTHDESDGDFPINLFKNDGHTVRVEATHAPIRGVKGVFGISHQAQTSQANIPRITPCSNNASDPCRQNPKIQPHQIEPGARKHWALIPNTSTSQSVFLMERYEKDKLALEVGVRSETQRIDIDHDLPALLESQKKMEGCSGGFGGLLRRCRPGSAPLPDLSTYTDRATSYLGQASYQLTPYHTLSATYSHNERHPTPMELYYHGKHLATVSLEHGNRYLNKEISDNYELNLSYQKDRLSYQTSLYQNDFKNRVFNQTLAKVGNLSLNRYSQSKATYYGAEGRLDYQVTPATKVGVFGDYVRGKLYDLPSIKKQVTKVDGTGNTYIEDDWIAQSDQNAPRVPPMRLGVRASSYLSDAVSAKVEYTHVFDQKKTAPLEADSPKAHLLGLGLQYDRIFGAGEYQAFIQADNLLNERVYSHASTLPFVPQMGRNVSIGVNVKF